MFFFASSSSSFFYYFFLCLLLFLLFYSTVFPFHAANTFILYYLYSCPSCVSFSKKKVSFSNWAVRERNGNQIKKNYKTAENCLKNSEKKVKIESGAKLNLNFIDSRRWVCVCVYYAFLCYLKSIISYCFVFPFNLK